MNIPLLIVNALALLVLLAHIVLGDKDIKYIEPDAENQKKLEIWIMARGAFHIVSVDMLMITLGLTLINFTSFLDEYRIILLKIMSIYFLLYAAFFFVYTCISKPLPKKFIKLCQWAVFLMMGCLIYFGI